MERQRFEALDGLRGVAALTVVLYHAADVTGVSLSPGGFLSVDVFFVLSGFVIALSYERRLREGLGLAGFLRARARRLLPVHFWAIGIVTAVTLVAFRYGDARVGLSATAIVLAGLLNACLIPDPIHGPGIGASSAAAFPINPPLWSLWDEWVINILFAAALFRVRTRSLALISGSTLAIVAIVVFSKGGVWNFGDHFGALPFSVFRALGGFTAGTLIYRLYEKGWIGRLPSVRPLWVYAAWLFVCALPPMATQFALQCVAVVVVAPLSVALLVNANRGAGQVCLRLGKLSYPLYVSHQAIIVLGMVLDRHFMPVPSALYLTAIIILALTLAQIVDLLSSIRLAPVLSRFAWGKGAA